MSARRKWPAHVWLPYVRGGSGTDVFTIEMAASLRQLGVKASPTPFPHNCQYAPWLLKAAKAPTGADALISNSWNGFAFMRDQFRDRHVTVEHLFVRDPAYAPYKTMAQAIFHETIVRLAESASFRAATRIVAVSDATACAMEKTLGRGGIVTVPNGIDAEFFSPGEAARPPASPFRLLFVGNPTRRKGADLLAPILDSLGPDYVLAFTCNRLEDHSLSRHPQARSLGKLSREGVRQAYREADLLVLPTRLEGLPLTAIEAMACGLPVVAGRTSSLPEVVQDGVTGRLATADDAAAFAGAIKDILTSPGRHEAMRRAARARVEKDFTLQRAAERYLDLLAG